MAKTKLHKTELNLNPPVICKKCGQTDLFLEVTDFGDQYEMKTPADYVCSECRPKPKLVPTDPSDIQMIECGECEGYGELDCDQGHSHECETCNGTGVTGDEA